MRGFALLHSWSSTLSAAQTCWSKSRGKDSHSPSVSSSAVVILIPSTHHTFFFFFLKTCCHVSLFIIISNITKKFKGLCSAVNSALFFVFISSTVCKTRVAHGTNSHEVRGPQDSEVTHTLKSLL